MSEISVSNLNSQAVPFFARYLEGQTVAGLPAKEMNAIRGGLMAMSLKYPSDQEDQISATQKYPSDTDEAMTQKYPSDGDDDWLTAFPKHLDR